MGEETKQVTITWVDSKSFGGGWFTSEEVEELHVDPCTTAGFIVREDAEFFFIAQTISNHGFLNITSIPKGCIKEIR